MTKTSLTREFILNMDSLSGKHTTSTYLKLFGNAAMEDVNIIESPIFFVLRNKAVLIMIPL